MYLSGLVFTKKKKVKEKFFYWYNNKMNTVEDLKIHFHKKFLEIINFASPIMRNIILKKLHCKKKSAE